MPDTGTLTLVTARLDFTAGRRTFLVGAARNLASDGSFQRPAVRGRLVGAGHAAQPWVQLFRQAPGQTTLRGFRPVKGNAEGRAAGAAGQAGAAGAGILFIRFISQSSHGWNAGWFEMAER